MISVAEAAPAKVIATSPTYLRRSLRRFVDCSRPSTPEGSQPAFAWGDLATPIRSITDRPSLAPSSCTRSPIGSPCGSLSPKGGLRAYHVASLKPRGLGPASTPVARHLRRGSSEPPDLATCLLAQACQHLWLVLGDDADGGSPGLTIPRTPGPRPPWCWQSRLRLTPGPPSRRIRLRCTEGSVPPRCQEGTPREETAGRTAGVVTSFTKSNTVSATPSCRTRTAQADALSALQGCRHSDSTRLFVRLRRQQPPAKNATRTPPLLQQPPSPTRVRTDLQRLGRGQNPTPEPDYPRSVALPPTRRLRRHSRRHPRCRLPSE
jgi:hypothetical protein